MISTSGPVNLLEKVENSRMWINASDLCCRLNHLPDFNALGTINGNTEGFKIFGKLIWSGRTGNRDHIARLRHLPGQNELRQSATFAVGMLLKLLDKLHIGIPVFCHETWVSQADVASGNAAW